MKLHVTNFANRNYIKPMFFGIAKVMVVFCRFFTTHLAGEFTKLRKFSTADSAMNGILGFSFLWVILTVTLMLFLENLTPLFALPISFSHSLAFWGFLVFSVILFSLWSFFIFLLIRNSAECFFSQVRAFFTFRPISTWAVVAFVKLRKWLFALALGALFHKGIIQNQLRSVNS